MGSNVSLFKNGMHPRHCKDNGFCIFFIFIYLFIFDKRVI